VFSRIIQVPGSTSSGSSSCSPATADWHYVTYATKHYYVYSFLNPNPPSYVTSNGVKSNVGGVGKGAVVGYVFGIAAAIIIIFCVSKGLQWVRKWVSEQKLGMKGKFYAAGEWGMERWSWRL